MSATDLITEFCDYLLKQKRYSINTVMSYRNDLTGLKDYVEQSYEGTSLSDINTQMLRSWLASLREEKMEPRSINRKLSAVRTFYRHLLKSGRVEKNPATAIPSLKTKKSLPDFVEQKQLDILLQRDFFPSGFDGDTRHLIFMLFYYTGMRVSELVHLKERDVWFQSDLISIIGKGNKQRQVPVDKKLILLVKQYIAEKKRLFENPAETLLVNEKNLPLSREVVYRIVRGSLEEVTTIQKKSPHVLRHSFATHLSDNGAPISAIKELLGHSSLAATQVYTHTSIGRLKEIYKKTHPKS